MLRFLFWNLMGNDKATWPKRREVLRQHIVQMAASYAIDIFIFVESGFEPAELVDALNKPQVCRYSQPDNVNQRIQIITRIDPSRITRHTDSVDQRLTVRRLHTTPYTTFLAAVHMSSKRNRSESSQREDASRMMKELIQAESSREKLQLRTILVGDFNMNPFEHGMVAAELFNSVMTKELARQHTRTVDTTAYKLFYNPMWGHFGDHSPGPPGTYYYRRSEPVEYHWNMFDQLLLRPALVDELLDVRILDTDGITSLLTEKGRPDRNNVSDHLPLLFQLELTLQGDDQ